MLSNPYIKINFVAVVAVLQLKYAREVSTFFNMSMNNFSSKSIDNSGYHLIATPAYKSAEELYINVDSTGLMNDSLNSDLYSFDPTYYKEEWRNYKHNEFDNLELGKGYLYYAPMMFGNFSGLSFPSSEDYSMNLKWRQRESPKDCCEVI